MTSLTAIDTIVFDLGGVIMPIDYKLAEEAFRKIDPAAFEQGYAEIQATQLFERQERGEISDQEFYDAFRKAFNNESIQDGVIETAWNALLMSVPAGNIATLTWLSTNYRLLMLSNTNSVHWRKITAHFEQAGVSDLHLFFDKLFLSFRMNCRKPEQIIFETVAEKAGLTPDSFIYIEDSEANIEGAKRAGWNTFHYPANEPLSSGLPKWLLNHSIIAQ